jgi:hypothetical protein
MCRWSDYCVSINALYIVFMKKNLLFLFLLLHTVLFGQKDNTSAIFNIEKSAISSLENAPQEESMNSNKGIIIVLKDPSGREMTFQCYENTTMSEEMKMAYPTLRTYTGYDIANKSTSATITSFEGVLQAYIHHQYEAPIEINYDQKSKKYISTFHKSEEKHICGLNESHEIRDRDKSHSDRSVMPQNGSTLRTFDIALVITNGFVANFGPSFGGSANANGIAAATAIMNDINAVYKSTLAITFNLSTIIVDGSVYNIAGANPDLAGSTVKNYFPTDGSYDIGHVFHYIPNGGSGIAYKGVVCRDDLISYSPSSFPIKAGGVSTAVNRSTLYDIAIHEIGHQLGAGHTFSSSAVNIPFINCAGQFERKSSVEPGAGTTIMSYSNTCEPDNLTFQNGGEVPGDNTYFHAWSISEMLDYINSKSCYSSSPTTVNTPPVASANPCGVINDSIPKSTPFELIGSATDANNDNVSYQWDQVDTAVIAATLGGYCGGTTGPIFRSYPPTSSPKRTFPALEYILNNANIPMSTVGECLPSVARKLNFRFIARDNNVNAGGIDIQNLTVTVSNTGPLQVTAPNTNVTFSSGTAQTITWAVNNTNINSDSVNILLSVDGGLTYPYILAETPNDGSQTVTIPANIPGGTKARIRVESRKYSCIKFFDVSDFNFTITSSCVGVTTAITPASNLTTTLGNNALNLGMQNNLGAEITSISGTMTSTDINMNLTSISNLGACLIFGRLPKQKAFEFYVDLAGSYTITINSNLNRIMNLYSGTFDVASPCNNLLKSSSTATLNTTTGFYNINISANFTHALSPGTKYILVISGYDSNIPELEWTYSISFTKPVGSKIYNGVPTNNNYSYTYIAVNKSTNIITQQSATSNFTTLPSGTYDIYGVHYYSGSGPNPPNPTTVSPASWENQNFNTVKNSPTCIAISSNSRQVTIQECILTVTTEAASEPGSFASLMSTIPPGCKVIFALTIDNISLSSAIKIDSNNITIDGTGQNVLINFTNSTADYLVKNTATGVTFKNVSFKHTNPKSSANVLLNEGKITLEGVTLIGNVNEVLKNQTNANSTVTAKGIVSLRKT